MENCTSFRQLLTLVSFQFEKFEKSLKKGLPWWSWIFGSRSTSSFYCRAHAPALFTLIVVHSPLSFPVVAWLAFFEAKEGSKTFPTNPQNLRSREKGREGESLPSKLYLEEPQRWKERQTLIILKWLRITVFENRGKSRIQHCERSELRLHFERTNVD